MPRGRAFPRGGGRRESAVRQPRPWILAAREPPRTAGNRGREHRKVRHCSTFAGPALFGACSPRPSSHSRASAEASTRLPATFSACASAESQVNLNFLLCRSRSRPSSIAGDRSRSRPRRKRSVDGRAGSWVIPDPFQICIHTSFFVRSCRSALHSSSFYGAFSPEESDSTRTTLLYCRI